MGATARTYATRYDLDRAKKTVVFKASVDTRELTSTAVLSYPTPDLAGDIVVPEGLDFGRHMSDPRVDLEHRRDPDFGDATVGWARTSLGKSGGLYTVRRVPLECHDGRARELPVGTTHFDPKDRLQQQAFALVERDVLPAVSLEFIPDMRVAKSLGPSPLEPRDAYEFPRARVVTYTLCARGVCPEAVVAKSAHDPLRSVLSANRVGGEELHPTIKKALSHYLPGKPQLVRSGFAPVEKAMDEELTPVPDMPLDDVPEDVPEESAAPAVNGITAIYAHVEALQAACEQLERDAETSDSAEIVKEIHKLCEAGRALAEKAKAVGDRHDAKLQAAKGGKGGGGEEEPLPEESDDYEPDMETDEEGALKSVRAAYKPVLKACRVKRYSLAEIQKAERMKAEKEQAKRKVAEDDDEAAIAARFDRALKLYG
jgi:hypothetical protein